MVMVDIMQRADSSSKPSFSLPIKTRARPPEKLIAAMPNIRKSPAKSRLNFTTEIMVRI